LVNIDLALVTIRALYCSFASDRHVASVRPPMRR
jgi:hypothetical protein